jgi:hypothetical protein
MHTIDAGEKVTSPVNCTSDHSPDHTYYRDADGDGFGVPGPDVMQGCGDVAPRGFSTNAKDCDDADASKHLKRYRDRDQDGYGDPAGLTCVNADEPGFADQAEDCDDNAASRSPAAAEVWLDRIDQNCDGSDDLRGCIAAPDNPTESYATHKVIPFPDLDVVHVERHEGCKGADLYFVLLGACPVCGGGKSTVVIGNQGTAPAAFRVESNAEHVDIDAPLQPQTLSKPFQLRLNSPGSDVQISVLGNGAECDPENNARNVQVGFTDCVAP